MKKLLLFLGTSAIALSTLPATDMPFGSDTLPYAASRATLVVQSPGATRLESSSPSASLYRLNLGNLLYGNSEAKEVTVVIPKGADMLNPEKFAGSIVFLRGPLKPESLAGYGIPAQDSATGPIFEVIGGRHGVVPAETPALVEAVGDYVRSPETARVAWANRHVESSSLYLQRSAVAEARRKPGDPGCLGLLGKALESRKAAPLVKQEAIRALQAMGTPAVVEPLKNAAENTANSGPVRKTAVDALGRVPSGAHFLQDFKASSDPILSSAAVQVLQETAGPKKPNAQAVPVEGSLQERLSGVDSLSRLNTKEAASALKDLALDQKQNNLVRSNAILGLSQFETGIGLPALNDLAQKLPESELKELAATLAQP